MRHAPTKRVGRDRQRVSLIEMEASVSSALVLALLVSVAVGGCSYQAPSAAFPPEAESARLCGHYHPGGGYAFCEERFPFGRHD